MEATKEWVQLHMIACITVWIQTWSPLIEACLTTTTRATHVGGMEVGIVILTAPTHFIFTACIAIFVCGPIVCVKARSLEFLNQGLRPNQWIQTKCIAWFAHWPKSLFSWNGSIIRTERDGTARIIPDIYIYIYIYIWGLWLIKRALGGKKGATFKTLGACVCVCFCFTPWFLHINICQKTSSNKGCLGQHFGVWWPIITSQLEGTMGHNAQAPERTLTLKIGMEIQTTWTNVG